MKVYFKNLDGIRFFASLLVLVHHSFFFKKGYSDSFDFVNKLFEDAGRMGVNLFFVLSGFLISYLLLMEKDAQGTISYKKFYLRRILRIWPLYYGYGFVLTFIAPFVMQKLGLSGLVDFPTMLMNFGFLLLFAVNFQLAFVGENRGIFEVSWSVCIEEQFYLIWPILINNFRKKLPALLVTMFSISIFSRILLNYVLPALFPNQPAGKFYTINYDLIFDKLDLFGGGLFAAMLYSKRDQYAPLFKKFFQPWMQVLMTILAILYTVSLIKPQQRLFYILADHYICDILFGYVLLAAVLPGSIYKLENPLLKTLGKVSFGIYLFHTAVCQLVLILFKKYIGHPDSRIIYDIFYPLANLTITSAIAYLSYTYFEMWFLKKKNKFEVITTRL